MTASVLTIPQVYGWNILAASGIAMHCLITGFRCGAVRSKYKIDYPDMGNGRYAAKLTDDQWKDFNNYQRAHYNYVEGVATAVTLQLLGGLFFPEYVAALGLAYVVGRQLYSSGYISKGPDGRYAGALIVDFALLGKFVLTVYGAVKLLQLF